MKKFIKSVVLALVLMCSTNAMAQQEGLSEAGVNFGLMPGIKGSTNVGIGIKYGYMASDNLRFEASGMYYFKSKAASLSYIKDHVGPDGTMKDYMSGKDTYWIDANINAHYLFNVADKISIYPIFGFTTLFGKTSFEWKDKTNSMEGVPSKELDKNNNPVSYKGINEKFSDKHFRFGVNLGFGAQYEITEDFAITLEAKYKLVKDFADFNAALGCVVLF